MTGASAPEHKSKKKRAGGKRAADGAGGLTLGVEDPLVGGEPASTVLAQGQGPSDRRPGAVQSRRIVNVGPPRARQQYVLDRMAYLTEALSGSRAHTCSSGFCTSPARTSCRHPGR